jgi:hypothetical protein
VPVDADATGSGELLKVFVAGHSQLLIRSSKVIVGKSAASMSFRWKNLII